MANFICPFSKKVCKPSCEYWEFDKLNTKKLMGIIPISITPRDIISSGLFLNNLPLPLSIILNEYQKYYDLYHPEQTSTPRGRCLKIEKMNLTDDEEV